MTITELPAVGVAQRDDPVDSKADHPMRRVTEQVAFTPDSWTADTATDVAAYFDEQAATWTERFGVGHTEALADALARGLDVPEPAPRGLALDIGSGSGLASPLLVAAFDRVVSTDLSFEMLHRSPVDGPPRVLADAGWLPMPDASIDVVVLFNAFLFATEVDRVLAPRGRVVWVNAVGERTPIHLPAADVVQVLPGDWHGVASRAGDGTWCVARRAVSA